MDEKPKALGYLSAAPRVSTRPEAEAGGPRSHVRGVIRAFESLGWWVEPFIVGDRLPAKVSGKGGERALSAGPLRTFLADLVRLGMGAANARRARRELGGRVDWVYERFAALQSLGWAFRREGVPWILETNGLFFDEAKTERKSLVLTGIARKLEKAAYERCDVLVCVSEALKEVILEKTGVDPRKILVVPNGVDTAFFDPDLHAPKREFGGFTVGFVGTLLEWQGLDRLISAVGELRRGGLLVHATIVGDGPARVGLERLAREVRVDDSVRFVGRVSSDEVPDYIAGFDVGFSGQQGMKIGAMYHSPLKLYEYLSMGKPVIASAFDDARRLLGDGEAGFLFAPQDTEDLARAMKEAYHARSFFAGLAVPLREEILRHHSWEARVLEMISTLR